MPGGHLNNRCTSPRSHQKRMTLPADILTSPTAQPRHEVAPEERSARHSKPYNPTPELLLLTHQQGRAPRGNRRASRQDSHISSAEFRTSRHYSAGDVSHFGVSGLYLIQAARANAAGRARVTFANNRRQTLRFTSAAACCLYTARDLHNLQQGRAKSLLLAQPANTTSCSSVFTTISSCVTAIRGQRLCESYKRQRRSSFSS